MTLLAAPPLAWAGFAYVGVFSMFLGFFAWYRGLALGGIAVVGQTQLLQPFLTLFASQAAVHQLAAVARRARRVVVPLDQQHREPAPRRRQRHRRAADASADDQQILAAHRRLPELKRPSGSKWAMAASIAARPAAPFSTPR